MSSSPPGSSALAALGMLPSALSSGALSSAPLAAVPSALGGHSLGTMFSQSLNSRSSSGNGGGIGIGIGQGQQMQAASNYLNVNVNYSAINVNPLANSSSTSSATGVTPLPAPSPASYLYPSYSHSHTHEPSPSSNTPYPLPYPYTNLNVYYPTAASTSAVGFANNPQVYSNVQNRSSAAGLHSSGSSTNIRSMQSFDPIPSVYDSNPASSSTANVPFQPVARAQSAHSGATLNVPPVPPRRTAQDVYTPFPDALNEAMQAQSHGQSTPFYGGSAAAGLTAPSPMQSSAPTSAPSVYHLNHRVNSTGSLMQNPSPPESSAGFDSYAQSVLASSFPYRATLPMAMQPSRIHSPQQLSMHPQGSAAGYLQSNVGLNDEIRSRKRKPVADGSDTSTSDNTPGDHSTSPTSPSISASPYMLANVMNHPHPHTAAFNPLHQSLLPQGHAHHHQLLRAAHPSSAHAFHAHQQIPTGLMHPLAQVGVYNAAHPSFMNAMPTVGSGEHLASSSVAVLSELTDEQLEQEAKFVLGDRQCELMTVMLREVGAWHRRQYWAGKLKESNESAWRDFLNIARNRSLDLQTLEHHWQSRVCNPFDGHNMDKFNRRLAYLGLQVEWRRGTQKSEYRIIRIARMMPIEGNKPQHSDAQMQPAHGKKLNYRSAMWYKRAKRTSDADESAEEDGKGKAQGRDDDSNDEEVMAIQRHSLQAAAANTQQNVAQTDNARSSEAAAKSATAGFSLKSSSSSLKGASPSSDEDEDDVQSDGSGAWSPSLSSSPALSGSSSTQLAQEVEWTVSEMSDFLFDLMRAQVHAETHSSDWRSSADWSLLLKRHNVALWNQFLQRCRSRGYAASVVNRSWRNAFRRPFLYENLLQWNTRLANSADPFVIQERTDPQSQHKHFRIAATVKNVEEAAKRSMLIDSSNQQKFSQHRASSNSGGAAENSQFGGDRSAASPFDSSALDSQKPMDTIIHHPVLHPAHPGVSIVATSGMSGSAALFNLAASHISSSSSASSPSSCSATSTALAFSHPPSSSAVPRLPSTPTDMHVATSSAAITSESRAATAAKLFVF